MITYRLFDETENFITGDKRIWDNKLYEATNNMPVSNPGDMTYLPVFNANWNHSPDTTYFNIIYLNDTCIISIDVTVDDITFILPNPQSFKYKKFNFIVSTSGNELTIQTHDSSTFINNSKLSITYPATNDNVTFFSNSTGWQVNSQVTSVGGQIQPYLDEQSDMVFPLGGSDLTLILTGGNFDTDLSIDMGPQITVTSINIISFTELEVIFDTTSTLQSPYIITLSRGMSNHFGAEIKVSTGEIIGAGPAGTFITNFNHANGNTNGAALWGPDWDIWIDTGVNSVDGLFQDSNTTTPSGSTGPSAPYDSYFMFTERSSPNFGAADKDATVTTTNFRDATSIRFFYHMFGTNMGNLILQAQDGSNVWNTVQSWIGQQQTASSDPFFDSGIIDLTIFEPKAIRFLFTTPTNYQADICLDSIVIEST